MIASFDALEAHTKRVAANYPDEVQETVLAGPGINLKERGVLLAAIPALPQSYLKCAERFRLYGVRSGYFAFWPEAFDEGDLVKSLIKASTTVNPYHDRFAESKFIQVASWEADPITIASKEASEPEGSVFKFDVGNPSNRGVALAPDFGVFMLLVGNLDQAAFENEGQEAFNTFRISFEAVTSVEEYWYPWSKIAEVILLK